jgi:hypothetical protein
MEMDTWLVQIFLVGWPPMNLSLFLLLKKLFFADNGLHQLHPLTHATPHFSGNHICLTFKAIS